MTTSALNSALSGLRISQKALDVTAANISNASTEGYTRKTLPQSTMIADGVGIGVRYGEIQRYVDEAIQRDYRTQLGVQSYNTTTETYLSRIIALSGSTDAENNIGSAMGNLYNSFVSLSSLPDNLAKQNSVISSAETLARQMNNFASQISLIRNDVQTQLKSEVSNLNSSLDSIGQLNKAIAGMHAIGRSTAELEDQRDMLVKQVASQIDVNYYTDGSGVLVLQTKDGHILADRDARPISFSDGFLTVRNLYPDGTVSGVLLKDSDTSNYDMAAHSVGGSIGALLDMRDKELPSYNAQLDELAYQLAARFNEQGMTLFVDGSGTIPADNPTAYAGFAGTIKVNPNIVADPSLVQKGTTGVPSAASSNAMVNKIVNYTFGKTKDSLGTPQNAFNLSGAGYNQSIKFNIIGDPTATLQSFANAMLDGQAADYNTIKEAVTIESRYTQELQARLLDSSAVNTDQEMTRMIEFQRTYSASAKMISALDELFRDLLNAI